MIAERTKTLLRAAQAPGCVGGNPGLCARDLDIIGKLRASHDAAHLETILPKLDSWLLTAQRIRQSQP